jgi:hypothetical protein
MRYKEAEFEFEDQEEYETLVFYRRRPIGTIVTMIEPNGRYCFRLGCDPRRQPRTYRGRIRAARALRIIDDLKQMAEKKKLSMDEIIVRAWDAKPNSAPS